MKPEPIDLTGVTTVEELIIRVLQARLREVGALTIGLEQRDKQGLHDFRIACKRLRYALERFEDLEPSLQGVAERLALLQDALGEAHDRDVLLAILPPAMIATERRLRGEREACVERAVALWSDLQQTMRALDFHPV
ncbi:MAG TPA: CHAD domain-containing protein [Candidatus Babeliales bacterium]|nr:CHAD domain-containing protein [Candidatus Babeliales bacterium]